MKTEDWMRRLAHHYETVRDRHPGDRLMIVFDIDGTILDMRHPILHLLHEFDRMQGTRHFEALCLEEVDAHEARLEGWLGRLGLGAALRSEILRFCEERFWEPRTVLEAHRPFEGVLDVIRWFQAQPRTRVGLNTGRPETMRSATLRTLNHIGARFRVRFQDELLVMNPGRYEDGVERAKREGFRRLREAGHRVFAFVDNEPANLAAVAEADPGGEVLLLHADTIFESQREVLPRTAVSGRRYDLATLLERSRRAPEPPAGLPQSASACQRS